MFMVFSDLTRPVAVSVSADALDYPTCMIQGMRHSSQHQHQQTQDSPASAVPAPVPPGMSPAQASAAQRLGPQAQVFLHMHARLKQSPAYAEYKKGLRPRMAMKSALEARYVALWTSV